MPILFLRSICSVCLVATVLGNARAGITTLAISGGDADGISGAKYAEIFNGTLGEGGHVVYSAALELGFGGVTIADDQGVWLATPPGTSTALLAREGVGNVPGVADADFLSLGSVTVDGLGNVGLRAQLANGSVSSGNNQGWWRFAGGAGSLVARTGSGNVPGVAGADFAALSMEPRMASDGHSVLGGAMSLGASVSSANDKAIWAYDGAIGTLVVREGISAVPGLGGATFRNFVAQVSNQNDQIAFTGTLNLGGIVTASNDFGVWSYSGAIGTLIAREGMGNVAGVAGASFSTFQEPNLNSSGQVAFAATLQGAGGNDQGVWRYDDAVGTLLAQKGTGSVPEVPDAVFANFLSALLSDNTEVLVAATLESGPGGVGVGNNTGLWLLGGAGKLVARTGSGNVPGIAGANFLDFTTSALNANGDVAFAASLEIGLGGVLAGDDAGVWILDNSGAGMLVARKGDSLAGRTIESLGFLGGSGGGDGRPQGFNAAGQLALDVTFTNGDSGLFLYTPDSLYAADFDNDSDVDSEDLARWQESFSLNTNADADEDADTDGADLLIWQREFGSGAASQVVPDPNSNTTTVPEPITLILCLIAALLPSRSTQRGAQKFIVHCV